MSTVLIKGVPRHVIDRTFWIAHVPSDNAWIDSGERLEVRYWVPEAGVEATAVYCLGREGGRAPDEEEGPVPPAVVEAAEAYRAAVLWLHEVTNGIRWAFRAKAQKGDTVTVFKGRKVPKGQYRVTFAGAGQYGAFFNLVSIDGEERYYTYVAQDNCKLADPLAGVKIPAEYRDLLIVLGTIGTTAHCTTADDEIHLALLQLADRMEELGDARSVHVRNYAEFYVKTAGRYDRLYA
jgi:hypothetical protein